MITMRSEKLKHGQQEKGSRNIHEEFDLNITASELEQQPDVQWQLSENHNSQYNELPGRTEKHKDNHSVDVQKHGEQIHQTKTLERCIDHLLILAQSAEIVAQSEDGVAGMHTNNQNKDQEYPRELLDSLSVVSHESSQSCVFRNEVTRPRLTQIRKQARCKFLIMEQERPEDNQCKHLQGKTINLSQIKHQARCKSKNDLSPQEMITEPRNEQPQGRICQLREMKHQARSKGILTVKEGSSLSVVEGVAAHNIFRGDSQ